MASAWIVAYDQDSGLIAVVPEPSAVDIITIKYLTPKEQAGQIEKVCPQLQMHQPPDEPGSY